MIFRHPGLTLVLRKPEVDDVATLAQWLTMPEFGRMVDGSGAVASLDAGQRAMAMLRDNADDLSINKYLMAVDAATAEPIGLAMICKIDWKNRHAQYAYIIGNTRYRGTLAAGDMNVTAYNYMFNALDLRKVYGYVFEDNAASARLNLFGGQLDGRLRKHELDASGYRDVQLFSILKDEFDDFVCTHAKGVLRKHIALGLMRCPSP